MLTYQEKQLMMNQPVPSRQIAEVGTVYDDGISLIFDGKESEKHYLCNTNIAFSPGQKVRVEKIGGTYVVAYPIGTPRKDE